MLHLYQECKVLGTTKPERTKEQPWVCVMALITFNSGVAER